MTVQVGGVDMPDGSFALPVIPTPQMRGRPIRIISGLGLPFGLAVLDNGDIVVAEAGPQCVTVLDRNGFKLKEFGETKEGPFKHPLGVAISIDGHILVTDNHRIQKLTLDGVCVKCVGSKDEGSGPLEFNNPIGIAVHPTTGQIFVADMMNKRIQVFDKDLAFMQTIAHERILHPCDVAMDYEGFLYVADCGCGCIVKLTATGQNVTRIAIIRGALLRFYLTVQNSTIYVTEFVNNRVSIYDTSGKFLHFFDKKDTGGELNIPSGVTTDALGNLYISVANGKILVC